MSSKRVLFTATVQSHIMNFHLPYLQHWYQKGYEVHVATQMDENKYTEKMAEYPYVVWHHIDFSRNPFSKATVTSYLQLKEVMNKYQFELMHTHTPVASIVSRYAAKKCKIPKVVYTAHGFHFFKGAPIQNWLIYYPIEKYMARHTDALITMNEEDYQIANKKFKTRQSNGVYKVNGVGLDIEKYAVSEQKDLDFKRSLGLSENDFVITIVAELIKRKNHMQMILAMEEIKKIHKDIKVLFVGDGVLYDELKQIVATKDLTDTIHILGYRNDVAKILNITDCCALFSHHEGLPKNIMEAMAAGKPVIASNIRGNQDLVIDEKTGYLVPYNCIKETIQSVEKIYMLKDTRNLMSIDSLSTIQKYEIVNLVEKVSEIYNAIGKEA